MAKTNPKTLFLFALYEQTKGKPDFLTVKIGESKDYKDGQPTGAFTSTYIDVLVKNLGSAKVVFPYRAGLANELAIKLEFGERFALTDIGTVTDIKVSVYDGALSIKFLMEERRDDSFDL